MAFTISVDTAVLPANFTAPPNILSELRPDSSSPVWEYSDRELSLFLNRIPCSPIDGSTDAPWVLTNPSPNWSIMFHSNDIIYGTEYWVNYEPNCLLKYLRERADNYDLIYQRDGINIFTLQVSQIYESGAWKVRITDVWHTPIRISTESELILQDMQSIFTDHNQCAVCLDDAFLVRWPTCTHVFCSGCISTWRQINNTNTCPLCRA